jgi:hypothetical protein
MIKNSENIHNKKKKEKKKTGLEYAYIEKEKTASTDPHTPGSTKEDEFKHCRKRGSVLLKLLVQYLYSLVWPIHRIDA